MSQILSITLNVGVFPQNPSAFTEELFMSVFEYTRPVFKYIRPEHVPICLSGTEQKETQQVRRIY